MSTKGIRANAKLPTASKTTFGQTCSPNCGCVLRFETSLDETGRVANATYHAKTVVCGLDKEKQQLEPQLTFSTRDQKPMFVECQCNTLHTLAKQVVAYLPEKSLSKDLRNQVEFTGTRSSLAFGHAVLRKYQTPVVEKTPLFSSDKSKNTSTATVSAAPQDHSCLDLVEDALTSMIRQSAAPAPRKATSRTFVQYLTNHFQPMLEQAQEDEFVERYGRALRRIRKPRNMSVGKDSSATISTTASPRSISALTMMDHDDDDDMLEVEPPIPLEAVAAPNNDWETHVDEMMYGEQASMA